MKNLFALLCLCIIFSCSSDSSEPDTNGQTEQENVPETPDENIDETGGGEETKSLSYNLTVLAHFQEKTYEFSLENGDLIKDGELLELPESLRFLSRYKVEEDKFFVWDHNGLVWSYNVVSKEKATFSNYFDTNNVLVGRNKCTVPTYEEIITFYTTEDPSSDYYFVESYNMDTGETYQINLPDSALAISDCSSDFKTGTKDLLLYYHHDENDNPDYWGIIKLNDQAYSTSANLGLNPFAINNNEIVMFDIVDKEFYSYNTDSNSLSSPTNIYYQSQDLSSESSVLLGFKSDIRFPARFEAGKMMYYNGSGEIIPGGNISDFFGPAILDLDTGALDIFSSLKIYQTYFAISEGRYNLEILQSEIDLESETFVVTYKDAAYDSSPYGIMILDFEFNLLKHYEFGQLEPIAMIKH
ncbi:hypothetical protein [Flagellimonas okinawensis]|uniref:DUF4221 domain-containing protein n=1 Tax=Flagellimonas okinawensis TaxID=3031324 RepID=A0ABT5XIY1_9FLAO|nr:hypothetical protein [[Muricauda] okinawensis]MDF0705832.1 hypothetical protein [[Muricauda] okinawensis]